MVYVIESYARGIIIRVVVKLGLSTRGIRLADFPGSVPKWAALCSAVLDRGLGAATLLPVRGKRKMHARSRASMTSHTDKHESQNPHPSQTARRMRHPKNPSAQGRNVAVHAKRAKSRSDLRRATTSLLREARAAPKIRACNFGRPARVDSFRRHGHLQLRMKTAAPVF